LFIRKFSCYSVQVVQAAVLFIIDRKNYLFIRRSGACRADLKAVLIFIVHNKMTAPAGKEIFEGTMASYWMEDGILLSLSKNPKRTIENINENVNLVKQIAGNRRMPLLIYLSDSPIPDAATRKFSAEQLPLIYSAMAMVSKPGLLQYSSRLLNPTLSF